MPISNEIKSRRDTNSRESSASHRRSASGNEEYLGQATPGVVAYSPALVGQTSFIPIRSPSRQPSRSSLRRDDPPVAFYSASPTNESPLEKLSSPNSKIPRLHGSVSSATSSHSQPALYQTTSNSSSQYEYPMDPPQLPPSRSSSSIINRKASDDELFFPSAVDENVPRASARPSSDRKRQPLTTTPANAKSRRLSQDLDSLAKSASGASVVRTPSKVQRDTSLSRSTPVSATASPRTPGSEPRARAVTGNLTSRKRPGIAKPLPTHTTTPSSSSSKPRPRSVSTSLLADYDDTPERTVPPWQRNVSPLLYKTDRDAMLRDESCGDLNEMSMPRSSSRTWDE